jgi:hypothetical protein
MKKYLLLLISIAVVSTAFAQTPRIELYDLIKKLLSDSTGQENVGNWAVGEPKTYPVSWKADKLEMSDDTTINFFRMGTVDVLIHGKKPEARSGPWNIMLKGPRMGYISFSLLSPVFTEFKPASTLDSLFFMKPYKATLLKSCHTATSGYNYYAVKLPKKDPAYIRVGWLAQNGSAVLRLDVYDNWSKYAVKLECPVKGF